MPPAFTLACFRLPCAYRASSFSLLSDETYHDQTSKKKGYQQVARNKLRNHPLPRVHRLSEASSDERHLEPVIHLYSRTWLNFRYQINQHRPKLLCCQQLTITHRLTLKFTWSHCLSETRIRWFLNLRIETGPMSNQQSINKLPLIRSSQLRPSNKT